MKIFLAATITTLSFVGIGASAFEYKGTEVFLTYDRVYDEDDAVDATSLGFNSKMMFSEKFGAELGFGFVKTDNAIDSVLNLSAAGNYHFSQNAFVGVFFDRTRINAPSDLNANFYGVQGGYSVGAFDLSAFYGKSDYDLIGEKGDIFGLEATYALQSNFEFGAYYQSESILTTDLKDYGLLAAYTFGKNGSGVPIKLTGTLGKVDLDGPDVNRFTFSLSVPLQGEADKGRKLFNGHSPFTNLISIFGGA